MRSADARDRPQADQDLAETAGKAGGLPGRVLQGPDADRSSLIASLNAALATEIVCVLRYKRHQFMVQGIHARSIAAEFREHATEELGHMDELAARIVQLGGEPDFSPHGLSRRSHASYVPGVDVAHMIRENLVAERIAIDRYRAMIRDLHSDDSTTRRLLEGILATEEAHADDMANLLVDVQAPTTTR